MLEERQPANVDEQLRMLLQEAGLDNVPMDPASLEALKSYVVVANEETSRTAKENRPPPPPVSAATNRDAPPPVEPKQTPSWKPQSIAPPSGPVEEASFAPVEGATPVENRILEQLQRQNQLLVHMQRRIDGLTATVEHLTQRGGGPGGIPPPPPAGARPAHPSATRQQRFFAPPPVQATTIHPPPAGSRAVPLPPPPARAVHAVHAPPPPPRAGLLMAIRNSSVFKIAYLFWKLRDRHNVQPIDGGLVMKILFMMAVLTARLSSAGKKHGDEHWPKKFAVLGVLVLVGFLLQTGYLQYVHTFFVKEKYPERIFNGETVDDILRGGAGNHNHPAPPRPGAPPVPRVPRRPGALRGPPNANAQRGGWRNTFLGGMIPAGGGVLQDVALLFGSFLLSIFPMWQPEGPPPPRPVQPRQPAVAPAPEQQPPPAPGGLAAGPGEVRPPRDVLQPADDSDDDQGGNN